MIIAQFGVVKIILASKVKKKTSNLNKISKRKSFLFLNLSQFSKRSI
jgi:hypothetical protein